MFLQNLKDTISYKLDRYYFEGSDPLDKVSEIEIYASADASRVARCAHIMVRAEFMSGRIQTSLIMAKIRINPVHKSKRISIPRLELLILQECVELALKVGKILGIAQVIVMSDSLAALLQVKKGKDFGPGCLKTFVPNKVEKILNSIDIKCLRYINNEENPSDIGTRPISAKDFMDNSLWTRGQHFSQDQK